MEVHTCQTTTSLLLHSGAAVPDLEHGLRVGVGTEWPPSVAPEGLQGPVVGIGGLELPHRREATRQRSDHGHNLDERVRGVGPEAGGRAVRALGHALIVLRGL